MCAAEWVPDAPSAMHDEVWLSNAVAPCLCFARLPHAFAPCLCLEPLPSASSAICWLSVRPAWQLAVRRCAPVLGRAGMPCVPPRPTSHSRIACLLLMRLHASCRCELILPRVGWHVPGRHQRKRAASHGSPPSTQVVTQLEVAQFLPVMCVLPPRTAHGGQAWHPRQPKLSPLPGTAGTAAHHTEHPSIKPEPGWASRQGRAGNRRRQAGQQGKNGRQGAVGAWPWRFVVVA